MSTEPMSVEGNVDLVKRYFDCLRTLDSKGVEPLLADNLVQFIPSTNLKLSTPKGKAELLAQMESTMEVFERRQMMVKGVTAQADRVAVEAETLSVLKSNGRTYNNRYHFLFVIENGRIATIREYCDTAHAAEVFGL